MYKSLFMKEINLTFFYTPTHLKKTTKKKRLSVSLSVLIIWLKKNVFFVSQVICHANLVHRTPQFYIWLR